MNNLIFFISFFFCNFCYSYPQIPLTPGSYCSITNPDFDEFRYEIQIPHCKRNVSTRLKKELYKEYNIPYEEHSHYTIDHIIPLSLGGDNSKANLWPQHRKLYTGQIEHTLFLAVKNDNYPIQEAIDKLLYKKFNPDIPWEDIWTD